MDARINPLTGDYDGGRIADLSNAVYLRITVPRGSYWADPEFGMRQRTRLKDLERNKNLLIQDAREALQPLLDSGRADRIDVDAVWAHDGRLQLVGEVYQSGVSVATFSRYIKVA
jgi:phage gp46-like protein